MWSSWHILRLIKYENGNKTETILKEPIWCWLISSSILSVICRLSRFPAVVHLHLHINSNLRRNYLCHKQQIPAICCESIKIIWNQFLVFMILWITISHVHLIKRVYLKQSQSKKFVKRTDEVGFSRFNLRIRSCLEQVQTEVISGEFSMKPSHSYFGWV